MKSRRGTNARGDCGITMKMRPQDAAISGAPPPPGRRTLGRAYAPTTVVFNVEDNVDPFDGKTSKVTGTITADPAAPGQAQLEVSVDLASLDTGNNLRNQHMRDR